MTTGMTYEEQEDALNDAVSTMRSAIDDLKEFAEEQLTQQREAVLYLLKELGFDTTILQGNYNNSELPFDDVIVVQALRKQLDKMLCLNTAIVRASDSASVDIDNKGDNDND